MLRKLDQIECRDAILAQEPNGAYAEAQWPQAEFIVGNPPFLGGKVMRQGRRSKSGEAAGLGDDYVDALFAVYKAQVPAEADFVCYWFAKAWALILAGETQRVGLVATNSIRSGASRKIVQPITEHNKLFEAWSDEAWIVDGAAVRVSIVCFGDNLEKRLNGNVVQKINADLTSYIFNVISLVRIAENKNCAFQGITKGAPFEVARPVAVLGCKCR